MDPEKLNSQEGLEKKGGMGSESPEKIGEKNPSEFALAVADKIERKEADFLGQTEVMIKNNPDLPEESLGQLEEISKEARRIANQTKEKILGLISPEASLASEKLQELTPEELNLMMKRSGLKEESSAEDTELQEICFKKYDRFGAKVEEIIDVPINHLKAVGEEKIKQDLEREFFDEWGGQMDIKDIRYTTNEGRVFLIRKLLPPGWKLIRRCAPIPGASPFCKDVFYGYSLIPQKSFFLSLLHEIGHAYFCESLSKEEILRFMALTDELDFKRSTSGLTSEETELYKKYVINHEKKAWAYALKTLRRFRGEGIDLAPELTSIKEILCIVMASLSSYEKALSPEDHEEIIRVVFGGEIEKGEKFLKKSLREKK